MTNSANLAGTWTVTGKTGSKEVRPESSGQQISAISHDPIDSDASECDRYRTNLLRG